MNLKNIFKNKNKESQNKKENKEGSEVVMRENDNKKKGKNKRNLVLAGVGLLSVVGGTLAYFTTSDSFDNAFTTAKYESKVVESFTSPKTWTPGTTTSKTVTVTNNGNVDMAVRAKYTESWTDSSGKTLALQDSKGTTASVINFNTGWTKGTDNYYYYGSKTALTKLTAGQTSSSFISGVTFNKDIESSLTRTASDDGKTITYTSSGSGYDNATYKLVITIETIQYDQAATAWS